MPLKDFSIKTNDKQQDLVPSIDDPQKKQTLKLWGRLDRFMPRNIIICSGLEYVKIYLGFAIGPYTNK